MSARWPVVIAIMLALALVAGTALANLGPATIISNLLIWVFNALGAILEGFIDAFAPWRR